MEYTEDNRLKCEAFLKEYWSRKWNDISVMTDDPLWFPHRLDLESWGEHRNPHFVERGVYSHQVINPGDRVLELCCGDGFYAYHFFACKAAHVDCLDLNIDALSHAREYHALENIRYHRLNIITDPFPFQTYDVVVWDSAIRRLDVPSIEIVLDKIMTCLKPGGKFSAYEIFEEDEKPIEFITPLTRKQLEDMFKERFETVEYIRTLTPGRANYYFHCQKGLSCKDNC